MPPARPQRAASRSRDAPSWIAKAAGQGDDPVSLVVAPADARVTAAEAPGPTNVGAGAETRHVSRAEVDAPLPADLGAGDPPLRTRTTAMRVLGKIAGSPLTGLLEALMRPFRATPAAPVDPVGNPAQPETPAAAIDAALGELAAARGAWARVGRRERARILREVASNLRASAPEYARLHERQKGSYGEGLGGAYGEAGVMVLHCETTARALEAGFADAVQGVRATPTGHTAVSVFPYLPFDSLIFGAGEVELWIRPGEAPSRGALYRRKAAEGPGDGAVCLVLGAGNHAVIIVLDVLHALMAEDRVVVVKMNPVNDYFGPWLEAVMEPLVRRGALRVVYGGREVGEYLTSHAGVDAIHLTGSAATHDAIVFGAGPEGAARRARGEAVCAKPVTAELGNVTPLVIVPGRWSSRELDYWVDMAVWSKAQNSGHNCAATQVLVTDRGWPQRGEFLRRLRAAFARYPSRHCYYPGTAERVAAFRAKHPGALAQVGEGSGPGATPWLLAEGIPASEYEGSGEVWCTALEEVALEGCATVPEFLDAAAAFCNGALEGTLACALAVDPRTQREHGAAVERAVAALRYGSVCVNLPPPLAFALPAAPWGAWDAGRGADPSDIGTGTGFVHNALLFDHVEKGVLRFPFTIRPYPCYLPAHRNFRAMGPRILEAACGSVPAVLALVWAALRG